MKTETEIAKENVGKLGELLSPDKYVFMGKCQEHLASCKRDLGFLEDFEEDIIESCHYTTINGFIKRENDLKQAIKIYSDERIK